MKIKSFLSVMSLAVLPSITFAGECINYACNDSLVQSVSIAREGNIHLKLTDTLSNLKCVASNQQVILSKNNNPNFKQQFTALLSSQKTKQPVDLTYQQGSNQCVIDTVTVRH